MLIDHGYCLINEAPSSYCQRRRCQSGGGTGGSRKGTAAVPEIVGIPRLRLLNLGEMSRDIAT